jgi:hypothetical protein
MSANERLVALYRTDGVVPGALGVIVQPRAAADPPVVVVSPWPEVLAADRAFGIAVLSSGAAAPQWRQPQRVEVLRLAGAGAAGTVGFVWPAPPIVPAPAQLPAVGRPGFTGRIATSHDIATALAAASDEFSALVGPVAGVAVSVNVAGQAVAVSPEFLATQGDAPGVADGICRIFHWD